MTHDVNPFPYLTREVQSVHIWCRGRRFIVVSGRAAAAAAAAAASSSSPSGCWSHELPGLASYLPNSGPECLLVKYQD